MHVPSFRDLCRLNIKAADVSIHPTVKEWDWNDRHARNLAHSFCLSLNWVTSSHGCLCHVWNDNAPDDDLTRMEGLLHIL